MSAMVVTRPQKRTTVRLYSAPAAVRAIFKVLERTAPALGARWAERIWFTLPRASDAKRVTPATPGRPFAIEVDGHTVVGEVWGEGPAVYLMHGWAGRRTQLDAFVAPLVARGRRVVAFDAPSHGDSASGAFGPRSSSIPEFATALSTVVAAHGPASAIIAHSLGGTAAALALCDGLRADRVALLAPMASPESFARKFAVVLGFGGRIYPRLIRRVERRVGAPMHHFDVPELGRAIAMPPTLVVHDVDDASTPVTDGAAIAVAWPGSRLHLTSGLGHYRLLRDPEVVTEVVDFVTGPPRQPEGTA